MFKLNIMNKWKHTSGFCHRWRLDKDVAQPARAVKGPQSETRFLQLSMDCGLPEQASVSCISDTTAGKNMKDQIPAMEEFTV